MKASIKKFFTRKEFRVACMLVLFGTVQAFAQQASALAASIESEGKAWVIWSIRIVGGMMAIGGLLSVINGFTGNEEGYGKAAKIGAGLLLMAIGIYCLTSTTGLYGTLGLSNLFKTS